MYMYVSSVNVSGFAYRLSSINGLEYKCDMLNKSIGIKKA